MANLVARYRGAWDDLSASFDDVEAALRGGDQARLAKGRQGLLAWRRALRAVAVDLGALAREYDVTVGKNENGPPSD